MVQCQGGFSMNIKKISELSDTPVSTIRYYERIGLLPKPKRAQNGYRIYDEDTIFILTTIKNLSSLNFTLADIKKILLITEENGYSKTFIQKEIQLKIKEYQKNIKILEELNELMSDVLDKGIESPDFKLKWHFKKLQDILLKK